MWWQKTAEITELTPTTSVNVASAPRPLSGSPRTPAASRTCSAAIPPGPPGPPMASSPSGRRKEHSHARSSHHRTRHGRVVDRPRPTIEQPTDAVIKVVAACVCGSDLWPYRGTDAVTEQTPMGMMYVGVVEEIGDDVHSVAVGDFVVGSFWAPDNTARSAGRATSPTACTVRADGHNRHPGEYARVPLADGTLVATPEYPAADKIPSLLAASDVLGTGWFAAAAAEAGPERTVAVVGDVPRCLPLAVLAAKQMDAERIIAMSRHASRQALAREFAPRTSSRNAEPRGGTHQGVTRRPRCHSVVEAVGSQESMMQAIDSTRPAATSGSSASRTTSRSP